MKYILFISLLVATPKVSGNQLINIASESIIVVPEDWVLLSDPSEYPAQLVKKNLAELLIFKSTISEHETITDKETLKISVDRIIDEVILTLPEAQLLATSGFHEPPQIGFTLDFLSKDTITQIKMRHRLKGIIYRHPEKYQILFTLWGKVPFGRYDEAKDDLEFLQAGFNYYGNFVEEPFLEKISKLQLILLTMVIVTTLLMMRKGVTGIIRRREQNVHTTKTDIGQKDLNY